MMNLEEADRLILSRFVSGLEPVQADLSLPQLLALCRIAMEPGLSVNDLADRMRCPQQTASRYVATLLGRYETMNSTDSQTGSRSKLDPLISQEISQTDSRSRALFLSSQGRGLLKKIILQFSSGGKK